MQETLRAALAAVLAVAVLAWPGPAPAQDYPNRPVRVIVGFPPGTSADITARVIGARMGQLLGQPFVVENKPGAGSKLAAEQAARSAKDGYTLLMANISNTITTTANAAPLSFDFQKDLVPIVQLTTVPNVLVVHPSIGVKTVQDLIALAKAKPDELSFGSSGVATGTHLAGELFKMQTGTKMVHVPYPGSPQSVADLVAGRIQVLFAPASTVLPLVRDGKLVALASTEAKRTASAPDLPTMKEAGLTSYTTGLWFGLMAPTGTPNEVIEKINRAGNEALKAEEVSNATSPLGMDLVGGTPEDFARFIDREVKRWDEVVQAAGLRK
jgi:tripartite-type tricarboxylate transporter receptor subunit TctC